MPVHPQPAPPQPIGDGLRVGRQAGAGGLSCDDPRLSRVHFEIRPVGASLRLDDQGAKNGTRVDGRPVQRAHLEHGSIVRAGDSLFVVEDVAPPAPGCDDPPAGLSAVLSWAQQVVDRVAPTALTVLVHGPSGAGKERLARRLHETSGRRGAFVPVNCSALPATLAASELFGHVRGAFSGAEGRPGLLAAAAGGTLFLDEVGDLPLDLQPVLLRAIQERAIRPVGGDREVPIDVRIVAATHRSLPEAVAAGRFRADLLARLTEFEVELPGLAERKADVLPLFEALVGQPVSVDAAEALLLHDWPTNVRGLQQIANRIRLFADGRGRVELSMLPTAMQDAVGTGALEPAQISPAELARLLELHQGNVSRVARAVGSTRQRVYRLLESLDIDVRSFR